MEIFKTLEAGMWLVIMWTIIGTAFGFGWIVLGLVLGLAACLCRFLWVRMDLRRQEAVAQEIARKRAANIRRRYL